MRAAQKPGPGPANLFRGADSTINRIATFVKILKTTAAPTIAFWPWKFSAAMPVTPLSRGGVAADADAIIIPEIPCDFDVLYAHMKQAIFNAS